MATKYYTVVVTGSRHWTNESKIKHWLQSESDALREQGKTLRVYVGYNPKKKTPKGVDRMVYMWCRNLGIEVEPFPADWSIGLSGGFKRNEQMVDMPGVDEVVAFRARGKSNGTDHCIKYARRKEIPVSVNQDG